jgi:hypothetical protein
MNVAVSTVSVGCRAAALAVAVALLASVSSNSASAASVAVGWELYSTDATKASFPGLGNLMGVPLGTYDFGSGAKNTAATDTIIQRTSAAIIASSPGTATANTQVVALQLETTAPVNFSGFGLDNYFMTLQAVHGGPASTGTESITFNTNTSGTFATSLDLFFDIRKGSLTGPIVASTDQVLTSNGVAWINTQPAGSLAIAGVNLNLNGANNLNDFWSNPLTMTSPAGFNMSVIVAKVPEPSTWVLGLTALASLCTLVNRRHRAVRQ